MGLIVSSLSEIPKVDGANRSLYIYLLDYGWPAGGYDQLFHENWRRLSQRASETGSVIIRSERGVHFANEVLSWHSICGHDAENLLPAMLITHSPPSYFSIDAFPASNDILSPPSSNDPTADLGDIALLPLKSFCRQPSDFLDAIASIFSDLERGLTLRNFKLERFDVIKPKKNSWPKWAANRVGEAFILQPNVAGFGVDLKKLFAARFGQKSEE